MNRYKAAQNQAPSTFGSETTGHGSVRSTIVENEEGVFVTVSDATANKIAPTIIHSLLRR